MCVVPVTLHTLFFTPTINIFSPFWPNCSSEKENGRQGMHFKGFFFFDLNSVALRKAKIVYNFGLSECSRVKRKTIVLSKHINIILFEIFSYFFNCQK